MCVEKKMVLNRGQKRMECRRVWSSGGYKACFLLKVLDLFMYLLMMGVAEVKKSKKLQISLDT